MSFIADLVTRTQGIRQTCSLFEKSNLILVFKLGNMKEGNCGYFLLALFLVSFVNEGKAQELDWLVSKVSQPVQLDLLDSGQICLRNGLVSRIFGTATPDFFTLDFRSDIYDRSILRALGPEGTIMLDGQQYSLGGAIQSFPASYLNRSSDPPQVDPKAWHFSRYYTSAPVAPFSWTPGTRGSPPDVAWPPKGLHLTVELKAPEDAPPSHQAIMVSVHYEMYEGIPLLSKWITASPSNETLSLSDPVVVTTASPEFLCVNHPYAPISFSPVPQPWSIGPGSTASWLYVETDQAHGAACAWTQDSRQQASPGASEPVLNCSYSGESGVGVILENSGDIFTSFRVLELVTDSYDLERVHLSRCRMTRLLAPHTQENPIFFHLTKTDDVSFRKAINQMADVGFEMLIYSFGSGFNLEKQDVLYLNQIKSQVDYAHSHGIEVGGYDLICLDRGHDGYGGNVGDQWDTVDKDGNLGLDACFASGWEDKIHDIIFNFIDSTGLSMLETDGPYGGGSCASTNHSHHSGLADSVYRQNELQGKLFHELKERNVYINQPDSYFYQGGSKTGMGYDENQYSLPRWEDISVSRATMYDDTYHYLPSQGWMFVPLVEYHGGGSNATFEPLHEHPLEYEWALAQYMGYGVGACYRGYELYDDDNTQNIVKKWVGFYKSHRQILISDIVHLKRPDMQGIDAILHVNPALDECGLAMVFNPASSVVNTNFTLSVYYTGAVDAILVQQEDIGDYQSVELSRTFTVSLPLKMNPKSITWFSFKC